MTQAYCRVCGANRSHRPRVIEVRDIGTVSEVLKTCSQNPRKPTTRANLARWRQVNDFPKPFKTVGRRVELWNLAEVRAWWDTWLAKRAEREEW